jgi:hypothetical protein
MTPMISWNDMETCFCQWVAYNGHDLHNVDEFMDDNNDDDTSNMGNMYRRNGNGMSPSGITTAYTEDTFGVESSGGTHQSYDQLQKSGANKDRVLNPHTNPFAPRVGETLVWCNVNMTLLSCWLVCVCMLKTDKWRL